MLRLLCLVGLAEFVVPLQHPPRTRPDGLLVLVRHGESTYNKNNMFCGWADSVLTKEGEEAARQTGELLSKRGFEFDRVFTSELSRAQKTVECMVGPMKLGGSKWQGEAECTWRLNERHYGDLQGRRKDDPELLSRFGEDTVWNWRRSFDSPPPAMSPDHGDYPYSSSRGVVAESLSDCLERVRTYWEESICPCLEEGEQVLVVAHANTLRSLIKVIDGVSDQAVRNIFVPNTIPMVYHLDRVSLAPLGPKDCNGMAGEFLVTPENHERVAALYDTGLLRTLFSSLDLNGDGFIDRAELRVGLLRAEDNDSRGDLQNLSTGDIDGDGKISFDEFVVSMSSPQARASFRLLT